MSERVLRPTVPVLNNQGKTVQAFECVPNESYRVSEYMLPSRFGLDSLFFKLYNNYYDTACTHDNVTKPRLVMETPVHPPESKAPGEYFKFEDWPDSITFHIEAKHNPCQLCNTIWLQGLLVQYCDNGSILEGYHTDIPFVLQPPHTRVLRPRLPRLSRQTAAEQVGHPKKNEVTDGSNDHALQSAP